MAKSIRSKSKRAFRKQRAEKLAVAPHKAEAEERLQAVMDKSLAAGEAAQLQRAAEQADGMQVEAKPQDAAEQAAEAPMDVDSNKKSRKGFKVRGKISKKGANKSRNPLNIPFKPSNTKIAKAKGAHKKPSKAKGRKGRK